VNALGRASGRDGRRRAAGLEGLFKLDPFKGVDHPRNSMLVSPSAYHGTVRSDGEATLVYLTEMSANDGFVASRSVAEKGKELASKYQAGLPFPHIVIDDFLPEAILEKCLAEFPHGTDDVFNRDQERLKSSYNPDMLTQGLRTLFYSFNSRPFIQVLENITSIKGLIPDPYFLGAGFHEIKQGGHLSIHADFNHHKPMNLERRINVLIYLNKDWSEEYGGQLELWDEGMAKKYHSILPAFNRCVIFNTSSNSQHGNPEPVKHPLGVSRKSIALYYYTATWDQSKRSHTTQFQVRPGSQDKYDWRVKLDETIRDFLPPIVVRSLKKLSKKSA
jgi:hypothetical protein